MTDIVQRLREAHPNSPQNAAGSTILLEAATEIERLRSLIQSEVDYLEERQSKKFLRKSLAYEAMLWQRLTSAKNPDQQSDGGSHDPGL